MACRRWTGTSRAILPLLAPLLLASATQTARPDDADGTKPIGSVEVTFVGLRSSRGEIRACLTADPRFFPDCAADPRARRMSIAAAPDARMRFADVPGGDYAIAALHDENDNGRADMFLGIPREGVGFSGNPRLRFGPPPFDRARITIGAHLSGEQIRMKYFL